MLANNKEAIIAFCATLLILAALLLLIAISGTKEDTISVKKQCQVKGGQYVSGKGIELCIKDGLVIEAK